MIVRSSTESGLLPGFAWRANRDLANDLLIEERPAHTRRGELKWIYIHMKIKWKIFL